MPLLLLHAWRNLRRNRRRSALTGMLIALGLTSLILFDGFTRGMMERMVSSATFLGQGIIQNSTFVAARDVSATIPADSALWIRLHSVSGLAGWTRRSVTVAMLSSPDGSRPALFLGIDPETEGTVSPLPTSLVQGEFLPAGHSDRALLGTLLAKSLKVELGDKVVLTSAGKSGDLVQEVFRVGGLLQTGIEDFDKSVFAIRLDQAQKLLSIGDSVHEIALRFRKLGDASLPPDSPFRNLVSGTVVIRGWPELVPELSKLIGMVDWGMGILALILAIAASVGVLNTLSMAIFERTWEIGVLRALGTRRSRVVTLILLEAFFLALASTAVGIVIAVAGMVLLQFTGVNLSGTEFSGAAINGLIFPRFHPRQFYLYIPGAILFTVLVALFPAWKASRISPTRAMAETKT